MGFSVIFFINGRLWNRWGGVICSFLALFSGSSGRWVVARGRGRFFEKVAQGAVTSSRFTKKFFTNSD